MNVVVESILRSGTLPEGSPVVVACSGGPDSTALVLGLFELRAALRLDLHVAYVDHGLRAASAMDREARYVERLCRRAQASFARLAIRIEGRSLEASAREARYGALGEHARRTGAQIVATGHTRSDQAETVLLRILRGAGLDGLGGMAPRRRLDPAEPPVWLVRPLLAARRLDVETALDAWGARPCLDGTNGLADRPRTALRHRVLPLLRLDDPAVDEKLAALADVARRLSVAADALGSEAVRADSSLDRAAFLSLGPELGARAVRTILRRAQSPTGSIAAGRSGVEALVRWSAEAARRGGRSRALAVAGSPLPWVVSRSGDAVRVGVPIERPSGESLPVDLGALGAYGGPSVFVSEDLRARAIVDRPIDTDVGAAGAGAVLRGRQPGDRFAGHRTRLKKVLIDLGVPRELRPWVPVVARGSEVLAVPDRLWPHRLRARATERARSLRVELLPSNPLCTFFAGGLKR